MPKTEAARKDQRGTDVASIRTLLENIPETKTLTLLRKEYASILKPNPKTYWVDLIASGSIGWLAFSLSLNTAAGTALYFLTSLVAAFALLRSVLFIHEIAHYKRGTLPGFEIAWHFVVGLPFLLPSFMYVGSHGDHHRPHVYGTIQDPEYTKLASGNVLTLLAFVLGTIFVPVLLILRWGLLGPVSYFSPKMRAFLIRHGSTLVINPWYQRPFTKPRYRRRWLIQELAVTFIVWAVSCGLVAEQLPIHLLFQWYFVTTCMLMINQIRTIAAHRYKSIGTELSLQQQLVDSVTLTGSSVFTVLAAPVGLRFHALHHLLPNVPYHYLGEIHRVFVAALPEAIGYQQTTETSISCAIANLVRSFKKRKAEPKINEEVADEEPSRESAKPI